MVTGLSSDFSCTYAQMVTYAQMATNTFINLLRNLMTQGVGRTYSNLTIISFFAPGFWVMLICLFSWWLQLPKHGFLNSLYFFSLIWNGSITTNNLHSFSLFLDFLLYYVILLCYASSLVYCFNVDILCSIRLYNMFSIWQGWCSFFALLEFNFLFSTYLLISHINFLTIPLLKNGIYLMTSFGKN